MKNPRFEYHRPETVADALTLLADHGDEAKVLAGGQSLLPLMGLRLATPAPGLSALTRRGALTGRADEARRRGAEARCDVCDDAGACARARARLP